MKCSFCNQEIKENAKFCNHCGNKVVIEQKREIVDSGMTWKCDACGAVNNEKDKYCIKCGNSYQQRKKQVENHYNETRKTKSGSGLLIGGGLVIGALLVLLVVVIVLPKNSTFLRIVNNSVFGNSEDNTDEEKNNSTEESSKIEENGLSADEKLSKADDKNEETSSEELSPEEIMYKPVLDAYKHAMEMEDISDPIINNYVVRYCLYVGNAEIGYTFYDINEDGTLELLVGLNRRWSFEICDIFSFDGSDVVDIFETLKGEKELLEVDNLCYVNICTNGYLEGRYYSEPINDKLSSENYQAEYVSIDLSNESKVDLEALDWKVIVKAEEPRMMTKEKMKEIVGIKFTYEHEYGEVKEWIDDYNGDGKYEAFVETDWGMPDSALYFVSDIGCKDMCEVPTYGEVGDVYSEGKIKYLIWEDWSSGEPKTYTVNDMGEPIVVS